VARGTSSLALDMVSLWQCYPHPGIKFTHHSKYPERSLLSSALIMHEATASFTYTLHTTVANLKSTEPPITVGLTQNHHEIYFIEISNYNPKMKSITYLSYPHVANKNLILFILW